MPGSAKLRVNLTMHRFSDIYKLKATISYILAIVLINNSFAYMPSMAAFGQAFSPADIVIGIIYILRDFAQREIGHRVLIAMLIGGILSYISATPTIAIASISAFSVGELIDWLLYTFTKRPLSKRLLLSSSISSPIDSLVFLIVAHQLTWMQFSMMTLGKISGILAIWYLWKKSNLAAV